MYRCILLPVPGTSTAVVHVPGMYSAHLTSSSTYPPLVLTLHGLNCSGALHVREPRRPRASIETNLATSPPGANGGDHQTAAPQPTLADAAAGDQLLAAPALAPVVAGPYLSAYWGAPMERQLLVDRFCNPSSLIRL